MTKESLIIWDTEFWSDKGTMQRSWGGLTDYPRLLVQIGAVKVSIKAGLPIIDDLILYVKPRINGKNAPLTSYFTQLTNITQKQVDKKGLDLNSALVKFKEFCGDSLMFSYGSDDKVLAENCYIQEVNNPFKLKQMRSVPKLLYNRCGISERVLSTNTSGTLASYFGVKLDNHHVHDARDDARSIHAALQYLENKNILKLQDLSPHHCPQLWGRAVIEK